MSVRHCVDARKQQDVGGYDIRPEILDMRGSAADVENATFRATFKELPMKITVQQADRFLLFPLIAVNNLTLVQITRAPRYG
jgi:hypothetical protein